VTNFARSSGVFAEKKGVRAKKAGKLLCMLSAVLAYQIEAWPPQAAHGKNHYAQYLEKINATAEHCP
jgi:hypothetical protein